MFLTCRSRCGHYRITLAKGGDDALVLLKSTAAVLYSLFGKVESLLGSSQQILTATVITTKIFREIELVVVMSAVDLWKCSELAGKGWTSLIALVRRFVNISENKVLDPRRMARSTISSPAFNRFSTNFPTPLHRVFDQGPQRF
jgi:hypothetical protein